MERHGIRVEPARLEAFAKELAPYERRKGTLKFPLSEPVPVRLIERIAKFRARQLMTRNAATGRRKSGREGQVDRIRRICAALPSAFEKMSHGTPCFFVNGRRHEGAASVTELSRAIETAEEAQSQPTQ